MIEFVVFEIRAISIIGTFGCKLMDNANFGVAHVQYHEASRGLSVTYHDLVFVGGPTASPTNPIWRTAAILNFG